MGGTRFYLKKFKMIPKELYFLAQANGEENGPKGIKMREKASKCYIWEQTLGSHTQGILRNAHKKYCFKSHQVQLSFEIQWHE